jgi:hypothetical protein
MQRPETIFYRPLLAPVSNGADDAKHQFNCYDAAISDVAQQVGKDE